MCWLSFTGRILVMYEQHPRKCWSLMFLMSQLWLMLDVYNLLVLHPFLWYDVIWLVKFSNKWDLSGVVLIVFLHFSFDWVLKFGYVQQGTKRMPGTAVTKSVVATEPGGRRREEIFVDIIEKISITFSSSVRTCVFIWLK